MNIYWNLELEWLHINQDLGVTKRNMDRRLRIWEGQGFVFISVIRIMIDASAILLSLMAYQRLCISSQLQKASKKQSSMFFHS